MTKRLLNKHTKMNLRDHTTFEDYCRERWGMVSSRARQLIASAEVVGNLQSVTTVTLLPTAELQAEFECLGSLLRTNGYGLKGAIGRVKSALSRLQNELEERLAQDHPAEWTTDVYHGDVDKRDAVRYMASITGLRED